MVQLTQDECGPGFFEFHSEVNTISIKPGEDEAVFSYPVSIAITSLVILVFKL